MEKQMLKLKRKTKRKQNQQQNNLLLKKVHPDPTTVRLGHLQELVMKQKMIRKLVMATVILL
jgi:hypothetical protein